MMCNTKTVLSHFIPKIQFKGIRDEEKKAVIV